MVFYCQLNDSVQHRQKETFITKKVSKTGPPRMQSEDQVRISLKYREGFPLKGLSHEVFTIFFGLNGFI
jgi:hypothetical protein